MKTDEIRRLLDKVAGCEHYSKSVPLTVRQARDALTELLAIKERQKGCDCIMTYEIDDGLTRRSERKLGWKEYASHVFDYCPDCGKNLR